MAAIRMLFSWLTEKGVLAMNPAREVKTERFSRTEGKTPAFVDGEVQRLLDAIETSTHTGLRDRALLGVLAYTFARIGAVVNLKVEDYYPSGKRFLLRFKEKGGKEKELPVHHKLEELLDQYLKITGLEKEPGCPLFPASIGKTGKLSRRPLVRTDAADMLKRRLKKAGLPAHYSPHSFRATGIKNFLENDGTLEAAQRIAGHADSRTTKLYDRRGQKVLLEDMERDSVLKPRLHGGLSQVGLFDLVGNHESWRITTMTPIVPTIYFLNDNLCAVTSNCLYIFDLTTKLITPYQPCTHILTVLQKEESGVMSDSTNEWMKMGIKSIAPASSPVIFDTIEGGASCYSGAISPGNKALAAVVYFSDRRALLIWDLTTRKRVREWTCPGALAVAWSPLDGQLLVGGVGILRLYRFKEIAHD